MPINTRRTTDRPSAVPESPKPDKNPRAGRTPDFGEKPRSPKPADGPLEYMIPAKKAAAVTGCSFRTLKKMAERRQVPAMRVGNRWMFLPSVLDNWRKEKLMANWKDRETGI